MLSKNLPKVLRIFLVLVVFFTGVWAQANGVMDEVQFLLPDIQFLLVQHLELTAISGSLAILVAIPVGVFLSRPSVGAWAESLLQVFNIGTTIPTLAVLALL